MTPPLRLHLRDLSHSLVEAWRQEFEGLDGITISRGDIFSEREGQVSPKDPIDIRADAIISPANSFGFMDGGIDAVYTYQLGQQVQDRLRELLEKDWAASCPWAARCSSPPVARRFPGASARPPCACPRMSARR
ncbi:hypothetical protein [Myxococcus faecalis]|uniref:hypothetical protein n=1 Tax=Myxococcus faecalis TaxID=3115646 RepID=UPI003CECFF08